MRTIQQIGIDRLTRYALCTDGTLWFQQGKKNETVDDVDGAVVERLVWSAWEFIEGPPEGRPDYKEPTLEEQAEKLRVQGGSATFVGRGHQLSGKPGDKS